MLRARSRSLPPPSPSSLPPSALAAALVTWKIRDICNLRLFKETKGTQENVEEQTQPQTHRAAVCQRLVMLCQPSPSWWGCGPSTLLRPLLGNAQPHSQCHRCDSPSLGQGGVKRTRAVSNPLPLSLCQGKDQPLLWGAGTSSTGRGWWRKSWGPTLAAPKSSCKGREVLVAQTSPGAALWAPQQRLGGCTPSPGCAAQAGSRIALSPMLAGSPWAS